MVRFDVRLDQFGKVIYLNCFRSQRHSFLVDNRHMNFVGSGNDLVIDAGLSPVGSRNNISNEQA